LIDFFQEFCMTRISRQRFAVASGLVALAATSVGVAQQESPGERYARTLAQADITARYNTQLEQQLSSQAEEIAQIEAQIAALDTTAVDVQPLLQRMFDELVQFVSNDVPFFKDERDQRIERIREVVSRVEATPSEKFRRIMEAYQIEMEYGRTMSAYRQTLADGREAEMVRLGRVVLLYRTIEGGETGYWDNQRKEWVADPASARVIEEALAIAKEERAPDLITVPVPAPQGGRS
jgi:seryl-tRNA synthetase